MNNVNTKNTEFVQGYGQYNRLFSDRFYGGLRLDGQYDGIAGVDYRFKVSPHGGLLPDQERQDDAGGGSRPIVDHGASGRRELRIPTWLLVLAERLITS